MSSTRWASAAVAGLAIAALGGWLAVPSGASPQWLGAPRMWHGIEIRSLYPVPAQFQRAHAAATHASDASTQTRATAATSTTTTGTTTTGTTPTTTTGTTTTGTTPTTTTTPTTKKKPPATVLLSNETSFTRWAYTNEIVWIHKSDASSSRRIVRTNWYTPDGFPELYLLLRQTTNSKGQVWVKLRIPGRPNGRVGWVPRRALSRYHLTHWLIVVNRVSAHMYVYDHGHKAWSAPVGVGKPATPTPTGHFWIREVFKISSPSSGYYPYAFGTTDYSTLTDWPGGGVVGIHGPYYDPSGIPGHISHGCIRLEVAADFWLARHVGLGVPVHVIS